jgi:uncharacterized membrane protein YccC
MVRSALAVCVPLALGLALGKHVPGLLVAIGGLLGAVADRGGTYPARLRRIAIAGIFGGAAGLILGGLVHGQGWLAVAVLVVVAGLSAALSAAGATLAITGLQLLVYTTLGSGPLGALRPWWWPPALLLAGVAWAMLCCVIVLAVGYAAWPSSWHAHLPEQFVRALDSVARYTEQALRGDPERSGLRRQAYRALSNLRTEFQRTMAEPPAVSRRAARLWPAMLALEQVTDAVTSTAVHSDQSGQWPAERDVGQLTAALRGLAGSARVSRVPDPPDLPGRADVGPVAEAIREVQRALAGERGS